METVFIDLLASKSKVLIAGDDDQALYSFKNAEARLIRELARGSEYVRFALPYCSRCTDVVVAAVNEVLKTALEKGNLQGRLQKEFECFVPAKATDSEAHPRIIHALCSVQSKRAPYVGRYIVDQVRAIPDQDIQESYDAGYPTVLVVGPNPFLDAALQTVRDAFPQTRRRKVDQPQIEPLDGYRYLAKDERSRLGWRILIASDAFDNSDEVLTRVAREEPDLVELIPGDYRDYHLALARSVGRLADGASLEQEELDRLGAATGRGPRELQAILNLAEENESPDEADLSEEGGADAGGEGVEATDEPSIIGTTLIGSKGLSAGHVFIVGFNNGHLPRDPSHISDEEVCQFLVGLSRTRKACHVVSVLHYGGKQLTVSKFAEWIAPYVKRLRVDKAYLEARE